MKKLNILAWIALAMSFVALFVAQRARGADPYAMTCTDDLVDRMGANMVRCENSEVVCYRTRATEAVALQCKWKEAK